MLKRLPPLPRRFELALFAVIAVVCALLTALFAAHDLALGILAIPIFIGSAYLGMRRSGQWQSFTEPVEAPAAPVEAGESVS